MGEGAVQQILDARERKGDFATFTDFCRKVEPSVLTKRVLESLVLAGAFDSLGYGRRPLHENQEKVSDATNNLADACSSCHEVYRDKGPADSPARCTPALTK